LSFPLSLSGENPGTTADLHVFTYENTGNSVYENCISFKTEVNRYFQDTFMAGRGYPELPGLVMPGTLLIP
jgi:hypothetical protein